MNAETTRPADEEPPDAAAPADLPLFGPLGAALASLKKNIEKRSAEAQEEREEEKPEPDSMEEIQKMLMRGSIEEAIKHYNAMIQKGENLEKCIDDLRNALYRYPVDINIWQALGDAYAQNGQLQEAIDAYTKAEELLR